jgi:hypothetical protein
MMDIFHGCMTGDDAWGVWFSTVFIVDFASLDICSAFASLIILCFCIFCFFGFREGSNLGSYIQAIPTLAKDTFRSPASDTIEEKAFSRSYGVHHDQILHIGGGPSMKIANPQTFQNTI